MENKKNYHKNRNSKMNKRMNKQKIRSNPAKTIRMIKMKIKMRKAVVKMTISNRTNLETGRKRNSQNRINKNRQNRKSKKSKNNPNL